jgi:hypothetical protein
LAFSGCGAERACKASDWSSCNLILISIDTLRADRLGAYGYERPTSPAIDAFASRGVRFSRVLADSPWTLPSHWSLLTGLVPSSHGATLLGATPSASVTPLAAHLQHHGYRTFAFTGGGYMGASFGFDRGFEVYDDSQSSLIGSLQRAAGTLASLDESERVFLFLHGYDVHCPYVPAEKWAVMFRSTGAADHVETAAKCPDTTGGRCTRRFREFRSCCAPPVCPRQ